jgi:hypothetical protein
MLLHKVLKDICEQNNIRYYSPNQTGRNALPFDSIFEGNDFVAKRNGCFGPIRFFVPTKALEAANVILHLRDPRDVLTSMFFSYCFIHDGEIERNMGYRKEVAEAGIDTFVLDMVGEQFNRYRGDYGIGSRYKKYVGNVYDRYVPYLRLIEQPNTVLVSYEQMVLEFPAWLRKILSAFDLENPEQTFKLVVARHGQSVKPRAENIWSHRRKITPGDHREKLRPETIAQLNERFSDVLDALGYSASDQAAS